MEDLAELLRQNKLFREIPGEVIRQYILPRGAIRAYERGSHVIFVDEKVNEVKILLSGKVNVIYSYADGSYSLAATELPPRVLAVDLIAAKSKNAPYYAVAAEACTVFSFPAALILEGGVLPEEARQNLLRQLLTMLSHLHMEKEQHLMILSRSGLRDRVMTYLSLQARWKKTAHFTIPFSREEMAAYLCVNRSTLSHELSLMEQEGLIRFRKNSFTLLNYDSFGTVP